MFIFAKYFYFMKNFNFLKTEKMDLSQFRIEAAISCLHLPLVLLVQSFGERVKGTTVRYGGK